MVNLLEREIGMGYFIAKLCRKRLFCLLFFSVFTCIIIARQGIIIIKIQAKVEMLVLKKTYFEFFSSTASQRELEICAFEEEINTVERTGKISTRRTFVS